MAYTTRILTVSDRASRGEREDLSGPAAAEILPDDRFDVVGVDVVPDESMAIVAYLRTAVDEGVALVVTTGGTGFAPRDVTPEATLEVIERRADGLAESMRRESMNKTPYAMLSRGVAGIAGRTLIVNLPGSPKAVAECLQVILPVLPHALKLIAGDSAAEREHRRGDG